MKHFTIDIDQNITTYEDVKDAYAAAAADDQHWYFATKAKLADLTKDWKGSDWVALWNSLPGVTPVKKFKSNAAALTRIWDRLNETAAVAEPVEPKAKKAAEKPTKPAKVAKKAAAKPEAKPEVAREGSKKAQVIEMLRQPAGATLSEIMKRMGWLPHTTRAMMSAGGSLAKAGLTVESFKTEAGERAFRIA